MTAASANALSYRVQSNFGFRLALNCNDQNDYANLFGHCRMTPRENPGRGVIMLEKRILEWQAAIFGKSDKEAERSQELLSFLETLDGNRARPIPVIPANPEWKEYGQLDDVIAMAKEGDRLPFRVVSLADRDRQAGERVGEKDLSVTRSIYEKRRFLYIVDR